MTALVARVADFCGIREAKLGFDLQITRYVFEAKNAGADFADVATLGRQSLHLSPEVLSREARRFGLEAIADQPEGVFTSDGYVEALLSTLGAKHCHSIDASDFEGATHVLDLNRPVPDALAGAFSTIIDGGTLEHVFDFPQAIRNVSKMLRVGGHFISINGTNNFMGHGFYQFSPELFFRAFSNKNGYDIESMVVTEVNDDGVWYEVTDPASYGDRVQLVNNSRTYLMMRARKTADAPDFVEFPQQSDYANTAWQREGPEARSFLVRPWRQRVVEKFAPGPLRRGLRRLSQATRRHFAAAAYQRREFGSQ